MEPIEVNAGAWYLRALRADERVDDRPALLALAADPATGLARRGVGDLAGATEHVAGRARGWADGTLCSWAVCEPSTGAMLGEIVLFELHGGQGELGCWLLAEHRGRGTMSTAVAAVLRLALAAPALGGLGLHRVEWRTASNNHASLALAARLGFTREDVSPGTGFAGADQVVLARLATD